MREGKRDKENQTYIQCVVVDPQQEAEQLIRRGHTIELEGKLIQARNGGYTMGNGYHMEVIVEQDSIARF